MLTWVIAKARIDSSLNLYEQPVPMKTTAALRGQPCGANPAGATLRDRLPCLSCIRLALYTAIRGFKTPRKAVYSHGLSPKMASGSAHGAFLPAQMCPKGKTSAFWRILAVPRKKSRSRPMLAYFEAIFGLPLAEQGSFGPQNKTGSPLRADHLSGTFSVGVQF